MSQRRHTMRWWRLVGGVVGSTWAGRWHDVAKNCSISRVWGVAYPMLLQIGIAFVLRYPWEQVLVAIQVDPDLAVIM